MNRISDWQLEGQISVTLLGRPSPRKGFLGRAVLAWRVLRNQAVLPSVAIVGNHITAPSGGTGIKVREVRADSAQVEFTDTKA